MKLIEHYSDEFTQITWVNLPLDMRLGRMNDAVKLSKTYLWYSELESGTEILETWR